MSELSLADIAAHVADQPVDAKRIKGLTLFITGQIAAAGTIDAGTGFTVNRSATGVFDITFTTAFTAAPTVVVTPKDGGSFNRTWYIANLSVSGVTVMVGGTATGAGVNLPFHFVAFPTA